VVVGNKFAILEIEAYFEGREKDFFEDKKNTMLKRAVERDLEINRRSSN